MAQKWSNRTTKNSRNNQDLFGVIDNDSQLFRTMERQYAHTVFDTEVVTMDSTNYDLNTTQLEMLAAPGNALWAWKPLGITMYLNYSAPVFDFPAGGIDLIFNGASGTSLINIPQADINNSATLIKYYPLETEKELQFNDVLELYSSADPTQGGSTVSFKLVTGLIQMD